MKTTHFYRFPYGECPQIPKISKTTKTLYKCIYNMKTKTTNTNLFEIQTNTNKYKTIQKIQKI